MYYNGSSSKGPVALVGQMGDAAHKRALDNIHDAGEETIWSFSAHATHCILLNSSLSPLEGRVRGGEGLQCVVSVCLSICCLVFPCFRRERLAQRAVLLEILLLIKPS
jgi:hypothetical protein